MKLNNLLEKIKNVRVLIIGDIILDTYWMGNVKRISPEAPIPIVNLKYTELKGGGAANVALNCCIFNNHTSIISVIGKDETAKDLLHILEEKKINTSFIVQSENRITTNKIRVIGNHQQITRIDNEQTNYIDETLEKKVLQNFNQIIKNKIPNIVILQDYNKGVLTPNLIQKIISLCNKNNITTIVDPKKDNFFLYKNCTIFKPNLKELQDGLDIQIEHINKNTLDILHHTLHKKIKHQISLITLSEKGIFFNQNTKSAIIPAHIRNIADVSGAGDTVVSVAALVYSATKNIQLTAKLANLAGGIVCEELGTTPINKDKFISEIKHYIKELK